MTGIHKQQRAGRDRAKRAFQYAAFVAIALILPTVLSAQRRPIQFKDLIAVRRPEDIDVSPDGRWVLFTITDEDLERNSFTPHLWIAPLGIAPLGPAPVASSVAGGGEKRIDSAAEGESGGRFSPDGKQILFLSARGASGQQIYLASFDSIRGTVGEPRLLTRLSTGAGGALWSPDGSKILFASTVYPECGGTFPQADACNRQHQHEEANAQGKPMIFTQLFIRHWDHYIVGDACSHIFLVPSAGGDPRDLTPGITRDLTGYTFSPDGKEIAFEWNRDPDPELSTNSDIYTLSLVTAGAQPVRISTSPGGDFTPRYSPDGRYIAFRSQATAGYESDRYRLMLYDRESRKIRELLPSFDYWVYSLAWSADGKEIYFLSDVEGEGPVFEVDVNGKRLRRLTGLGYYSDLKPTNDGKRIVLTRTTFVQPADIYVLRLDRPSQAMALPESTISERSGKNPEPSPVHAETTLLQQDRITDLNGALLAQLEIQDREPFWFKGAQGARVEGFLLRPPNFDPKRKYPVKFLLHGGPEGDFGDIFGGDPEFLASSGYVIVMINFHGSTGYGQAFIDSIDRDWGGKPYIDLMRGLDYAEAHYPFIDKSRECAMGGSFGGYMANWILGHTQRFRCIVSTDGMFDTESAYGTTDELWFPEREFNGTPWTNRALYRRWSPMVYAANFKTPTLVVHGQLDYRLDVSQGIALFTTLQRLHVPSKMLYFPDEKHVIVKPQDMELWYKTANGWVDQWTK